MSTMGTVTDRASTVPTHVEAAAAGGWEGGGGGSPEGARDGWERRAWINQKGAGHPAGCGSHHSQDHT